MIRTSFWLTNISNRNVSLTDLALTVRAHTSVNLLDKKHYQYSQEQLEESAKNGSIFKKGRLLKVRRVAPIQVSSDMLLEREAVIPTRQRSILEIKEDNYEELSITDEQFVQDVMEDAPKPTKS